VRGGVVAVRIRRTPVLHVIERERHGAGDFRSIPRHRGTVAFDDEVGRGGIVFGDVMTGGEPGEEGGRGRHDGKRGESG